MGESSWMLKDSLAQWTEEFLENEKYSSQRDWFICKGEGGQQPGTSGTAPTGTGSIAASSEGPTKADRARGFPNLMSCTSNTPEITRTYSSPPICLASSNSFSDSGSVGSIQSESALHMASFRRPLRRNHSNGSGNSELPRRASKSAPSQDVLIEASTDLASDGSVWSLGEKSDAIEMSLVETKPRPHIPVEHKRAVVESARRWAAINNPASVTANAAEPRTDKAGVGSVSGEGIQHANADEMKRIEATFHEAYNQLLNLSVIEEAQLENSRHSMESSHAGIDISSLHDRAEKPSTGRSSSSDADSILDLFLPNEMKSKNDATKTPVPDVSDKTTIKATAQVTATSSNGTFRDAASFFQKLEQESTSRFPSTFVNKNQSTTSNRRSVTRSLVE